MSMTLAGLEPAILASEERRLIHYVGHEWNESVMPRVPKPSAEHMRTPGIEPGSQAWEACLMPLRMYTMCASACVRTRNSRVPLAAHSYVCMHILRHFVHCATAQTRRTPATIPAHH